MNRNYYFNDKFEGDNYIYSINKKSNEKTCNYELPIMDGFEHFTTNTKKNVPANNAHISHMKIKTPTKLQKVISKI